MQDKVMGPDSDACMGNPVQLTVQERLEQEKKRLESRLKQVNEALDALHKNPEVMLVINKISAITHF